MRAATAKTVYGPQPVGLSPIEQNSQVLDQALRTHLPLVKRVVRRLLVHKPANVEADELVNWGLDGLLQALQRFDSTRQVEFEAYARLRIRGAILDRLRATDFMARSLRRKANKLERAYQTLEGRLGRPATEEEVAAELEMGVDELRDVLSAIGRSGVVGLEDLGEAPAQEQPAIEDILDVERVDPLAALLSRERAKLVADAIDRLPERERSVIALYYREGITMREVAAVLGVTESRVSQLHSQALLRLGGTLGQQFSKEDS
ncbi:MAG: FliA/WhiG family RNA polymerase sigma factor [Deltaproteobacteria bacterium]|nr:FliA/WhiG family RNA polymerase sigma factor [Deltaproteobacteria bacterium]